MSSIIGKEKLVSANMEKKQQMVLRLLDHVLQPSLFDDVTDVANRWHLEQNQKAFKKAGVVDAFLDFYQHGLLPRGEIFVESNTKHVEEAIKVFHLLYFAKDFDAFVNVACWLRERVNPGMFVYSFTASVFHRKDCHDIILPAPYEIYPYLFVNSDVINKAFMIKTTNGAAEATIMQYWMVNVNKNIVSIDSRPTLRHRFYLDDILSYFTEDIDLNTYMFYAHISYPYWATGEEYSTKNERRGETMLYILQQLLARLKLERLSHGMRDIAPISWDETLKTGYWPKIRLHTGDEMPARSNDTPIVHDYNAKTKQSVEDFETLLRLAISKGHYEVRDGIVIPLKEPQDIENLGRLMSTLHDPTAVYYGNWERKLLAYATYGTDKYCFVPTATDMYSTSLRDPAFWRVMKRNLLFSQLFKRQLPQYTQEVLDFPGVKVEGISTTELVTFFDTYDIDITNAVYLNAAEYRNKKSDFVYVARQRRLNNRPFKVTMDVTSTKAVDAVIRVFIGPKYDVLGRIIDINDKRLDMIEMDSFLYKLKSGQNTIVRDSTQFQGVVEDRPWTRPMWDSSVKGTKVGEDWWWKSRIGFPHRLLLPMGQRGGMHVQLFVVVSPVQTGNNLPSVDMQAMNERHCARWSTGFDSMPFGFPFDRIIDTSLFYTDNMRFADVLVYHKDLEKGADSDPLKKLWSRDDLSVLDKEYKHLRL